jgi:hypothetical protein
VGEYHSNAKDIVDFKVFQWIYLNLQIQVDTKLVVPRKNLHF